VEERHDGAAVGVVHDAHLEGVGERAPEIVARQIRRHDGRDLSKLVFAPRHSCSVLRVRFRYFFPFLRLAHELFRHRSI